MDQTGLEQCGCCGQDFSALAEGCMPRGKVGFFWEASAGRCGGYFGSQLRELDVQGASRRRHVELGAPTAEPCGAEEQIGCQRLPYKNRPPCEGFGGEMLEGLGGAKP